MRREAEWTAPNNGTIPAFGGSNIMNSTPQMSNIDFKSITNGESPRGRHQYMLLHTPKSGGTAIHPKLTVLVILSLAIGVILGGTWYKIDARTDPCTQSTRGVVSIGDYLLRSQHANGTLSTTWGNTSVTRGDSQLRNPNVDTALSIAWLMSFPVSYSLSYIACIGDESLLSQLDFIHLHP